MVILFIICLLISAAIVNLLTRIFMKMIGADFMLFSVGKRIIAILILAIIIMNLFL